MKHHIEAKLDAARVAAAAIGASGAADAVYVAGSLTAGLGNPTSDADVFVLVDDTANHSTQQQVHNGERVDIEYYTVAELAQAVERVTQTAVDHSTLSALWSLADEFDLVFRLLTSQIVHTSPRLQGIVGELHDREAAARSNAVNYWVLAANSDREDFIGAVLDEDWPTAAYAGQVMMTSAGKALTSAAGDLYHGRKWVYKQLGRSLPPAFPTADFAYFQRGNWAEDGAAGAAAALLFAQTCSLVAQLHPHGSLEGWRRWTVSASSRGYWRDPGYAVFGMGDRVLLHYELQRQLTLGPRTAAVWGLCMGLTAEQIIEEIQSSAWLSGLLGRVTAEDVERLLGDLADKGLIREGTLFAPGER